MSKRWILRIVSAIMLIIAFAVFCIALSAPTLTADPRITQPLFYGWIIAAIVLYIVSFFVKKK